MSREYKGIIDRFEGDIAVIEVEGKTRDYNRDRIPKEAEVGDVLLFKGDKVEILKDDTDRLRNEIEELMEEVWED
ncbi:DUF3006 domain-containing protein [Bacillus infantis]|uniref:DUF3006 domain-containing protein n=1 Tax=Bacillus infantis TaxID=324767 RepID=UPI00101C9763|nr:DUF3006 domain-containing protein [Bacillus infantis]RYI32034.1 DUF3006 domain-containing protein [Bacillus infantis]